MAVISEKRRSEVGRTAESYRRRYDMADHLHFIAENLQWLIETVDLGVERQRCVEVPYVIEAVGSVAHLGRQVRIPLAAHFRRIHPVVERHRRRYVDIVQQGERGRDRHRVLHSVAPVLDQAFLEKLVLGRCQGVVENALIAQLDFLIPSLGAYGMFALERSDLTQRNGYVWERNRQSRVLTALGNRRVGRERPFGSGQAVGQVYRARFRIFGESARIVAVEIVARISARGVVDARREIQVGIRLGILSVVPENLLQSFEQPIFSAVNH